MVRLDKGIEIYNHNIDRPIMQLLLAPADNNFLTCLTISQAGDANSQETNKICSSALHFGSYINRFEGIRHDTFQSSTYLNELLCFWRTERTILKRFVLCPFYCIGYSCINLKFSLSAIYVYYFIQVSRNFLQQNIALEPLYSNFPCSSKIVENAIQRERNIWCL